MKLAVGYSIHLSTGQVQFRRHFVYTAALVCLRDRVGQIHASGHGQPMTAIGIRGSTSEKVEPLVEPPLSPSYIAMTSMVSSGIIHASILDFGQFCCYIMYLLPISWTLRTGRPNFYAFNQGIGRSYHGYIYMHTPLSPDQHWQPCNYPHPTLETYADALWNDVSCTYSL
jgi:hypothetical protein